MNLSSSWVRQLVLVAEVVSLRDRVRNTAKKIIKKEKRQLKYCPNISQNSGRPDKQSIFFRQKLIGCVNTRAHKILEP